MSDGPAGTTGLAGERRQLTIMFCDLVGSTALSARLELEDLRDVLSAYQKRATEVVEAAGGRVARYEGDGILAYFGYPAASEDDAEQAVRAGLELARGIDVGGNLAQRLSLRVGIATGVVVVGELSRPGVADNPPVVGETPNLAARLQDMAEPGTVVIADSTRRLTGRLFEYRDCGLQQMDGFAQPMQAWQVLQPSHMASRFEALRSRALPLIGRNREIEDLRALWVQAKTGSGQVVLISGEPGIGKSRVAHELVMRVRAEPGMALRYYCSPHHQNSTLHPILEWLRRAAKLDPSDTAAARLDRVRPFLPEGGGPPAAAAAALAEMLALPAVTDVQETPSDARRKRELMFEGILTNLQRMASEQPIVAVVEDAHWIDPTSQELLDLLVDRVKGWPMLVVVTCRPQYQPRWRGEPHATLMPLQPIAADAAEALIQHIAGDTSLPGAVVREIAERADGIPLFIEELTRTVLDRQRPAAPAHALAAIPATLHASLMARLDRLGGAREVVKVAAALGRRFDFRVVRAVLSDHTEAGLDAALQQAITAGLVVPVGPSAPDAYAFRHALIQDAAYGSILRGERRALHGRIAMALVARFPDTVATQPEVVAGHFTNAELAEPAISYWREAGHRAARGWALIEATKHFREAIRLADQLPESPERSRTQLGLHLALGPAIMAIRGYAAPESLEVFSRARTLTDQTTTPVQQLEVLAGLFNVHYGRAELAQAMDAARQHLALADRHGAEQARANCFMAQTHMAMGEFEQARRYFEQALASFAEHPEDTRQLGIYGSQYVVARAFLAGVYWALGNPEKATDATAQSIAYARSSGHLLSIALALITRSLTPIPGGLKGEMAEIEEALAFCAQHGLANFETWAEFARGAVIARRGDAREAIGVMRAAIDRAEGMSSRLFRPVQFATLASAHARLGEVKEALALLDQALETAERTGERRANSALHRLRGEILIATGQRPEGERQLMLALAVAKAQGARSEEARTAATIAKLVPRPVTPAAPPAGRRPRLLAAWRSLFGS